jgi:hypothetical protein
MSHTDKALWEKIKKAVTEDDVGGKPGQWSAIKAMIASKKYKEAGGGYAGKKNYSKGLLKWIGEDWRTKSGKPSLETGERFLPRKAIEALSEEQYKKTSAIKRKDLKRGVQFSKQPDEIVEIANKFR